MIKFNELNRHFYIRLLVFYSSDSSLFHSYHSFYSRPFMIRLPSIVNVCVWTFGSSMIIISEENSNWCFFPFISFFVRTKSSLCQVKQTDLSISIECKDNNNFNVRSYWMLNVLNWWVFGIRFPLVSHRQNLKNPHIQTKMATVEPKHWIKTKRIKK